MGLGLRGEGYIPNNIYTLLSKGHHIVTIVINACTTNVTSHHPHLQFAVDFQFAGWDWDWEGGLKSDREGGCIGAPPIRGISSLS